MTTASPHEGQTELDQLTRELSGLVADYRKIAKRMSEIESRIIDLRSRAWIAANNVTLSQIHRSDDAPGYISHSFKFAEWIKTQRPLKRFTEWNTEIHFTTDFISGNFLSPPGRIADVPK